MYAYVKFLEGPNVGRKRKVSDKAIKYTFQSTAFNNTKKYYIQDTKDGKYYKSEINFLQNSEKNLDERLLTMESKRTRVKPDTILDTVTEQSESDYEPKIKKSKSMNVMDPANSQVILTRRQSYKSLLDVKLIEQQCNEKNHGKSALIPNTKTAVEPLSSPTASTSYASNQSTDVKRNVRQLQKHQQEVNSSQSMKPSTSNSSIQSGSGVIDNQDQASNGSMIQTRSNSFVQAASGVTDDQHQIISVQDISKSAETIEKLEKENENLKSKVKQVQKENEKLKLKVDNSKSILKEVQAECDDYKDKNKKLQEIIIDKFEEQNERLYSSIYHEVDECSEASVV